MKLICTTHNTLVSKTYDLTFFIGGYNQTMLLFFEKLLSKMVELAGLFQYYTFRFQFFY